MSVLLIQTAPPVGQTAVTSSNQMTQQTLPSLIYILTNDTFATVTATGYLTHLESQGYTFSNEQMALVYTSDQGPVWLAVAITYSGASVLNTVVSLVDVSNAGDVVLPTIANHLATYTNTTGTLSEDAATAINGGNIQAGLSGTAGYLASFPATMAKGSLRLTAVANTNDTLVTLSNVAMGQASVVSIPDPANAVGRLLIGATATPFVSGNFPVNSGTGGLMVDSGIPAANLILNSVAGGQSVAAASASATPGTIRALRGVMTLSNATYANTTNSVAGLRGEVDMVGASSGYVYGVQGKVIPTGTLSGSIWAPAVFGQYDLSGAILNAGQIAAVWGDMGATGGTFTNVSGARMFAGTNTIASLTLNAMDYRYGKASNLFELAGDAGTYITDGGSGAPSGTIKKIAITIDSVQYYLLAATVIS